MLQWEGNVQHSGAYARRNQTVAAFRHCMNGVAGAPPVRSDSELARNESITSRTTFIPRPVALEPRPVPLPGAQHHAAGARSGPRRPKPPRAGACGRRLGRAVVSEAYPAVESPGRRQLQELRRDLHPRIDAADFISRDVEDGA